VSRASRGQSLYPCLYRRSESLIHQLGRLPRSAATHEHFLGIGSGVAGVLLKTKARADSSILSQFPSYPARYLHKSADSRLPHLFVFLIVPSSFGVRAFLIRFWCLVALVSPIHNFHLGLASSGPAL
jgi:hypothetical protein